MEVVDYLYSRLLPSAKTALNKEQEKDSADLSGFSDEAAEVVVSQFLLVTGDLHSSLSILIHVSNVLYCYILPGRTQ